MIYPLLEDIDAIDLYSSYHTLGFVGPFSLPEQELRFSTKKKYYSKFSNYLLPNPLARHTLDKQIAALSAHPMILEKLIPLMGKDILLWGSQLIKQAGKKKKRFHVDAEYSAIDGASAWIAIQNIQSEKSFFLIAGSHLIATSPQELNKTEDLNLQDPEAVCRAAQRFNPECNLIRLAITDGEFILFHGKLWHGTANITSAPRYAINFRYTTPSQKVRISKDGELPDVHWLKQRPNCLLVNGNDCYGINKTSSLTSMNRIKALLKGYSYFLLINAGKNLWKHVRHLSLTK